MATSITHAGVVGLGRWYGFTSAEEADRWAERAKARLEAAGPGPYPTIVIVPACLADDPIPLYWSGSLDRFVTIPED